MTSPDKLLAAMRYMQMAAEKKHLEKAREAFRQAHNLDLVQAYNEAMRVIEGKA